MLAVPLLGRVERCPLMDDRERIEKQILASDGVIFASPVFAMNVTALMKKFLDRFAYTFTALGSSTSTP